MSCNDLTAQEHAVYRGLAAAGLTRIGIYRTTPTRLASSLNIDREEVRSSLEGLVDLRLVAMQPDGRLEALAAPCRCPRPRAGTIVPADTPFGGIVNQTTSLSIKISRDSSKEVHSDEDSYDDEGVVRRHDRACVRERGAPRRMSEPHRLVEHFKSRLMQRMWGKTPGGTHKDALRAHIKRWMAEDGLDPETIQQMIDLFTSDERNLQPGKPAWKSFINLRQRLLEEATKAIEHKQVSEISVEEQRARFASSGMWSRE